MRISFITILVFLILNVATDYYIWRRLKAAFRSRIWSNAQLWTAAILNIGLAALFFVPLKDISDESIRVLMWIIVGYISVYLPKYIFAIFDLSARIPRLFGARKSWRWLSICGVTIGVLAFIMLWWGALVNRFNIQITETEVEIPNLPASFDGMRIVQISDMHLGTYGNDTSFVSRLVDEVNGLKPDMILFTGDIVNRRTRELKPFMRTLSRLSAPRGVYSILGNHDYGDYTDWPDSAAKRANYDDMVASQADMGWRLLRNESVVLDNGSDSIALIGVENIGEPPFTTYGDLHKAYPNLNDSIVKILLTHNPRHWEFEVANSDKNIALTLSGHTHAMQMEAFGMSPAVFRYREWGGLYNDGTPNHQINVNIGTGTVGFPARIGATPQITVLTLHQANGSK